MEMVVVRVDETLIYCDAVKGGGVRAVSPEATLWTFDRDTGFELDHELRFGPMYGRTGSRLVPEGPELLKQERHLQVERRGSTVYVEGPLGEERDGEPYVGGIRVRREGDEPPDASLHMRVRDLPRPLAGSTKGTCVACGEEVWMDPSAAKIDVPRYCQICALELFGKRPS